MEPAVKVADDLDIDFDLAKALIDPETSPKAKVLKRGVGAIHEAFADYLLMNPQCTYKEMGAYFGYTGSWVCTVVNSDMFKAYFAERRKGIVVQIAQDLPARLAAAASLATEKVIGVLEKTEDPDTIIDAFDKILHRHGFAPNAKGGQQPGPQIGQQTNIFYLQKDDLAAARQQFIKAHQPAPLESKGDSAILPAPAS